MPQFEQHEYYGGKLPTGYNRQVMPDGHVITKREKVARVLITMGVRSVMGREIRNPFFPNQPEVDSVFEPRLRDESSQSDMLTSDSSE